MQATLAAARQAVRHQLERAAKADLDAASADLKAPERDETQAAAVTLEWALEPADDATVANGGSGGSGGCWLADAAASRPVSV